MARPSKFKPEFVDQAAKLAALGATDREIADFFGVDERTLHRWKHEHEAFCQSLKVGKSAADERVEQSLYRRAVGYSFDGEKVFQFQGQIVRADTVEHVPPDTTAAIFWLKNRRPEEWRDRQQLEVGKPGDFDRMTDDELERFIAAEAAALGGSDAGTAEAHHQAGLRKQPRGLH